LALSRTVVPRLLVAPTGLAVRGSICSSRAAPSAPCSVALAASAGGEATDGTWDPGNMEYSGIMRNLPASPTQDREILLIGAPCLRQRAKLVKPDRVTSVKSRECAEELVRVMRGLRVASLGIARGGVLAAPQLGTPSRVAAFEDPASFVDQLPAEQQEVEGRRAFGPKVIFNLKVQPIGDDTAVLWESSKSIPGYRALVERHLKVRVTGADPEGQEVDYVATGWEARLAQQAADVFDGSFLIDRCFTRSLRHLDAPEDPLPLDCPPEGRPTAPRPSEAEVEAAAAKSASSGGGGGGFFGLVLPFGGLGGAPEALKVGSVLLRLRAAEVSQDALDSQPVKDAMKAVRDALATGKHPLGLGAPQLGIRLRIVAVGETEAQVDRASARECSRMERAAFGPLILINPVVRPRGKQDAYFWERSASVPSYEAVVCRSLEVEVEALNDRGEKINFTAKGWKARMLQHAADVLDGTLYVDRMETRSWRRDKRKLEEGEEDTVPEGVPFGVKQRFEDRDKKKVQTNKPDALRRSR